MSEQEDKRAKQLEEARKRVEELKKKSKKDKKKKKQTKNVEDVKETSESENVDSEVIAGSPEETGVVDEEKSVDEGEVQPKAEPVEPSDDVEISESHAEEELNVPVNEDSLRQSSTDASQLFDDDNNDESDFMNTIKKQKESDDIQRLNTELEASTAECKKLKFINMEHETTIEDLQSEVEQLREELQTSQLKLHAVTESLAEAQTKLSTKQDGDSAHLQFAQFNNAESARHNAPGEAYRDATSNAQHYTPEIDRAALNKWRCWNVDMTSWRSIGNGPIFEF